MASDSPNKALVDHTDGINRAFNCVADGRLTTYEDRSKIQIGRPYAVTLAGTSHDHRGRGGLVRLRGVDQLWLGIQHIVVVESTLDRPRRFETRTLSYSYRFDIEVEHDRRELLAFHWTSLAEPPERRYPHLHVGSLVAAGSRFRGADFNKLHIPTGRLSLEAVLLFAIEDLGVEPARGRSVEAVLGLLREGDRVSQ